MAKMEIRGTDEYIKTLKKINDNAESVIKHAVYNGAGIVADAVRKSISTIPIQQGPKGYPPYMRDGKKLYGITSSQKSDLQNGLGLAPIQEFKLGYINTKLGFDGYGSKPTRKYPKGIPNVLLARALESGSSFRKKYPFVRTAVNQVKNQAVNTMDDTIQKEIRKEL